MAKLIGIQVQCPVKGAVTIPRRNFVIGPRHKWPEMYYSFVCVCGKGHRIAMRKPTDRMVDRIVLALTNSKPLDKKPKELKK